MSNASLIKWSGLAALVAGVLLAALQPFEIYVILGGDQLPEEATTNNTWLVTHLLLLGAAMLLLLGLVGIHARQAEKTGRLGTIGFLLAFLGSALLAGWLWTETFVAPAVAEVAIEMLGGEPRGTLAIGLALTFTLFGIGWLLFGLSGLLSKGQPLGGAVLIMLGAVLALVLAFAGVEAPIGTVLFGIGLIWVGYDVWARPEMSGGM